MFQATLAILDKLDIETENPTEEEVARKFGWEDDYLADDLSLWQRVKPKIFSLFDEPHSSTCARVSHPCKIGNSKPVGSNMDHFCSITIYFG